ncbi:hypothetical protein FRACYDRAFT_254184 [Fragilariopsis cylindrus CCMP1102]|uniref:Uncharacterized protein n=1 Tax=Fragilariopsis cylindrus CCMP1102 TaxID=635003 RepID=A0A1E7EM39_9STRA|nr:hypothetical protein FRACYDRAFT_254184 [Fragilariopsis cylindrus CCMP1102]|eukprot:OEU06633.1 hypothetical protein FRACYDRAFT_254184 [Fragilariopsis cylindrus CCMP1102]
MDGIRNGFCVSCVAMSEKVSTNTNTNTNTNTEVNDEKDDDQSKNDIEIKMNDDKDDDDKTSTYTESRSETEETDLFLKKEEEDDKDDKDEDDLVEEEDEEVGGNGYRRNNRKQLSGGKQMMVLAVTTRATTPRPRPPSITTITNARVEEGLTVEGDDVSAATTEMVVAGTESATEAMSLLTSPTRREKNDKLDEVKTTEIHTSRRNEKGKEKLRIPNTTRTNMNENENENEVEAEVKTIIEQQQQHHYHPHPSPVFIATGWPQRSPMMMMMPDKNNQTNDLHHQLRIDDVNNNDRQQPSTPSSSSRSQQEQQEQHHHALFSESFDTISANGASAIASVVEMTIKHELEQEQIYDDNNGSLLLLSSPKKSTTTAITRGNNDSSVGGGGGDGVGSGLFPSPRKKSHRHHYHKNLNNNHKQSPTSQSSYEDDDREDNNDDHSPSPSSHHHSPPQRVVHIDSSKGHLDCADISPIKFHHPNHQHTPNPYSRQPNMEREKDVHEGRIDDHYNTYQYTEQDSGSVDYHYHNLNRPPPTQKEVKGKTVTTAVGESNGHRYSRGQDLYNKNGNTDNNSPREVSFLNSHSESSDTPAAAKPTEQCQHQSSSSFRKRQTTKHYDGYDTGSPSNLSEAKTPPRRGTGGTASDRVGSNKSANKNKYLDGGHGYVADVGFRYNDQQYNHQGSISSAPPLPREFPHPPPPLSQYGYNYYPPSYYRDGGYPVAGGGDHQYHMQPHWQQHLPPHQHQYGPPKPLKPKFDQQERHDDDYDRPPSLPPLISSSPWMDCHRPYSEQQQQQQHRDYLPHRPRLLPPPPATPHGSGNGQANRRYQYHQQVNTHHDQQQQQDLYTPATAATATPPSSYYHNINVHPRTYSNDGGSDGRTDITTASNYQHSHQHHQPPSSSNNNYRDTKDNSTSTSTTTTTTARVPAYYGFNSNIGGRNDPFILLRSISTVFEGFSYLLGGVWVDNHHQTPRAIHMDSEDLKVARRRIESSIFALGGYIKTDIQQMRDDTDTNTSSSSATRTPPYRVHNLVSSNGGSNGSGSSTSNNSSNGNIFRRVNGHYKYRSSTSVLCSPSTTGSSGDRYKDRFHQRYFVGGQGIEWKVEENPPVFVSTDEEDVNSRRRRRRPNNNKRGTRTSPTTGISNSSPTTTTASRSGTSIFCQDVSNNEIEIASQEQRSSSDTTGKSSSTDGGDDPNKKIKYRCKLCGVPKQGHICPYSKKLQRTIGVMVCPAVNAYMSAEPGVLTLALSEMNNFVPYGSDAGNDESSSDDETEVASSSRGEVASNIDYILPPGGTKKVKVKRHHSNNNNHHSPNSSTSLSTTSRRSSTSKCHSQSTPLVGKSQVHDQQQKRGQKRRAVDSSSSTNATKIGSFKRPFVMSLALRPEHYRAVTPRTPHRNNSRRATKQKTNSDERRDDDDDGNNDDAYEYQHHVPLTFVGRKRLTDTLFYLCRHSCFPPSVITAEVASLLRTAREKNEWDLAVSEVLTQVVICINCSIGDYQLDGLRQYLLKIGISS